MLRVAGFVDIGYLWVQLTKVLTGEKKRRENVSVDYKRLHQAFLDYVESEFPNIPLLRIYWYDAPGLNGEKTPLHQNIDALDDFKLKLGTRNNVGNQKAVDGLITADMISLTQNKAITHAFLVSGDADLAPGVTAAQSQGLRVHLLSVGQQDAVSMYLESEVDKKNSWGTNIVSTFAHPVEQQAAAPPQPIANFDAQQTAQLFLENLPEEEKQRLGRGTILQDIDSRLLRFGFEAKGNRALAADEKTAMRKVLRAYQPN